MKSVWYLCQLPAFEVTDACCSLFLLPIGLELTFLEASGRFSSAFSQPGLERAWGWCHLTAFGLCKHVDICQDVTFCFLLKQQWLKVCQRINTLYYLQTCILGQGKCSATESPQSELFSVALKFHFMFSWYLPLLLCLFSLLCASD